MSDTKAPKKPIPYEIPKEGSLGLLALGYRGLVAWRAVRGTEWIEERRKENEELVKAMEAKKAEAEKAAAEKEVEETAEAAPAETSAPIRLPADVLEKLNITIVSGLPRSGTSMMMQMLMAGGMKAFTDEAREADESNPRGYFEHDKVKGTAKDSTWLKDANGQVVKVVAPLLRYLPPGPTYRVILMVRDIEEILSSQTAMLHRDGRSSADGDVLRRVYERQLAEAKIWVDRQEKASLLEVNHREAISDPGAAARAVSAFLPGGLPEADMASIVDSALHREHA